MNRLKRELRAGLGRRLQADYERQRRQWRESNPDRKYELTDSAVYVAPPELRPILGEERAG